MNIIDKIYIDREDVFNYSIGKNVVVITSSERKKTLFYQKHLANYQSIEINLEPEIESLDINYKQLKNKKIDTVIAYGGGSTIDSAKILAVSLKNKKIPSSLLENFNSRKKIKLIAIPTTFGSGSEATSIGVYKKNKKKLSIKNDLLVPNLIFLFKRSFDGSIKMARLFLADAFCHALESFYSNNSSHISRAISATSLKIICDNISFKDRINLAFASLLAGVAENFAGVSLIHALAYPLQNKLELSHSLSNSIILGFCEDGLMLGDKNYSQLLGYGLDNQKIKRSIRILSSNFKNNFKIDSEEFANDCLSYGHLLRNCKTKIDKNFLIKFYGKIS